MPKNSDSISVSGNRGDVDADEGLVGACRRVVDGLGQQFLAGPGFTGQQHRHVLPRRPAGQLLGADDALAVADIVVEGEARRAALRQLPPRDAQLVFEMLHPRDQGLQAFEMVVEHEADRADDVPVLVLDRHARDDELLAAELHDVEQDRLAGLRHAAHQAVGDDLLDRAAERLARRGQGRAKEGIFR